MLAHCRDRGARKGCPSPIQNTSGSNMHVLFVHQNFPAQFGHIARHLIRSRGWTCTFVSKTPAGKVEDIEKVEYTTRGGARETTHYCSRTFENAVWHAHGVYEACKARPDRRPDLIVGHSGFGSTVYLPELYPDVPIINYFEFYYHPHHSDMDFRPEFPPSELDFLRARSRNAMLLLDLETCRRGYSPTRFQQAPLPGDLPAQDRRHFRRNRDRSLPAPARRAPARSATARSHRRRGL